MRQHLERTPRHQLEDVHIADVVKQMGYSFVEHKFTLGQFVNEVRMYGGVDLEALLAHAPKLLKEIAGYGFLKQSVLTTQFDSNEFECYE